MALPSAAGSIRGPECECADVRADTRVLWGKGQGFTGTEGILGLPARAFEFFLGNPSKGASICFHILMRCVTPTACVGLSHKE